MTRMVRSHWWFAFWTLWSFGWFAWDLSQISQDSIFILTSAMMGIFCVVWVVLWSRRIQEW